MLPRRAAERGFTLLEIAVAVLILSLGTTLVAVNLDAMLPNSRLQACARALASQIADARSHAITQGIPYQIEYDLDKNRYRLLTPFKAGGGLALRPEDRVGLEWVDFPANVKLAGVTIGADESTERGITFVEFDSLGSSIEHQVNLRREKPEADFTLQVEALTGMVRFIAGKPKIERVDDGAFPQ